MIIVESLFPDEHHLQTEIWVSDAVREAIAQHTRSERPKSGFFLKKLKYYATGGFAEFEGDEKSPVRYEWGGVYRVGLHGKLFRVYGFYIGPKKLCFIAADAFLKKAGKLRPSEKDRIDEVVKIREKKQWRKRE